MVTLRRDAERRASWGREKERGQWGRTASPSCPTLRPAPSVMLQHRPHVNPRLAQCCQEPQQPQPGCGALGDNVFHKYCWLLGCRKGVQTPCVGQHSSTGLLPRPPPCLWALGASVQEGSKTCTPQQELCRVQEHA